MNRLNRSLRSLVVETPVLVEYFNEKGIDYCCGGEDFLGKALRDKGIENEIFLKEMDVFLEEAKEKDLEKKDLDVFELNILDLITHLERSHHERERKWLFEVDQDLNKIFIVHYDHHGEELVKVHNLFADLKKELEVHFVIEEKVTFPMILKDLEKGGMTEETLNKVEALEQDHEKVGTLIKELIDVTNHFQVPKDGCFTFKKTYDTLHALVEDIFLHIFKENSVLFEKLRRQVR